jgi:hypothetical protein
LFLTSDEVKNKDKQDWSFWVNKNEILWKNCLKFFCLNYFSGKWQN